MDTQWIKPNDRYSSFPAPRSPLPPRYPTSHSYPPLRKTGLQAKRLLLTGSAKGSGNTRLAAGKLCSGRRTSVLRSEDPWYVLLIAVNSLSRFFS